LSCGKLLRHDGYQLKWGFMANTLLDKSDPAPVVCLNRDGASPIILVSEHAGNKIPASLGNLGVSDHDLADHIGWDLHIKDVGIALSERLDAPYFYQPYSRLVIDCNRPPDSPQSILEVSDGRRISGNENLSTADVLARQQEIFQPFHGAISSLLNARMERGQTSILVTFHSFTPLMRAGAEVRPWQITFQYGRNPQMSHQLMKLLAEDPSVTVGDNVPYPVRPETNYGIPVHGEQRNLLHTMIEIRHDVIADEAGKALWVKKISNVLSDFLQTV